MKWNSIRTKVLGALGVCFLVALLAVLAFLRHSFFEEANALAEDSVGAAQRQFKVLEAREIGKLTAIGDALIGDSQIRDAFAAKDRNRLLGLTSPLFAELKAEGVTNWLFHEAEPAGVVFLRLHNPGKFGDKVDRFMYDQAVRTHQIVTGKELAKAGFALRILRPFYGSKGELIGYLELGEELGRFLRDMKTQSGDNYGLLLKKDMLDRASWADTAALFRRRDNWTDNPFVVVADRTTNSDAILRFEGDLAEVPEHGKALELSQQGDTMSVRGIFPIVDAANKKVGALFAVHDITKTYTRLTHMRTVLSIVMVAALGLCGLVLMVMLTRMVFLRLDGIVLVATRLVGGDYDSKINVSSSDEIGQFEQLFEQFREVFVNLLNEMGVEKEW